MVLITYKSKVLTKSHNKILHIVDNLLFYYSFVYISEVAFPYLFYIDKIEQVLIFEHLNCFTR